MIVTAPETRNEITYRLRQIEASPTATIDQEDSFGTCEFFVDDLAFDAPYDAMVGIVLYGNELSLFCKFMALLDRLCEHCEPLPDETWPITEFQKAASDLLKRMGRNDSR